MVKTKKDKNKKKKHYSNDFNTLLSSSDLAVYREPERKLDARDEATLTQVQRHIIRSRYYLPFNDPGSSYDIPDGIDVESSDVNNIRVPLARQDTARRYRVYYDTPDLKAFYSGVEIRIEFPGPLEHGHAKPYKQVIKLGRAATENDPTFHRLEISSRLEKPVPSFDPAAVDGQRQIAAFLQNLLDVTALRPLQLLTTVRTRYACRPGGNEDDIVEFGFDRGNGMTLTNWKYPILQLEPEVIKGDDSILEDVSRRLTSRFNEGLKVNLESKPTPGYEHLAEVLESKKARAFLLSLPRDRFRKITAEECPSLFPTP